MDVDLLLSGYRGAEDGLPGLRPLWPARRYRGCVSITQTCRLRFLETGQRASGDRKLGMDGSCELNGGCEIFFRGAQAERGFAWSLATQDLGDDRAAALHCR